MKRTFTLAAMALCTMLAMAQSGKAFDTYLYNDEHKIFLRINLYDKNVVVPGQEVFGEMDGYMGSKQCSHVWTIPKSVMKDDNEATLTLINNYGSEDLEARLTRQDDSTYVYRFLEGSTLKFPVNKKWQKIPKTVVFKRK